MCIYIVVTHVLLRERKSSVRLFTAAQCQHEYMTVLDLDSQILKVRPHYNTQPNPLTPFSKTISVYLEYVTCVGVWMKTRRVTLQHAKHSGKCRLLRECRLCT